jgi:hypothetical protein
MDPRIRIHTKMSWIRNTVPHLVVVDLADDAAQVGFPADIGDAAVVLKVHADVVHHCDGEWQDLAEVHLGVQPRRFTQADKTKCVKSVGYKETSSVFADQ